MNQLDEYLLITDRKANRLEMLLDSTDLGNSKGDKRNTNGNAKEMFVKTEDKLESKYDRVVNEKAADLRAKQH